VLAFALLQLHHCLEASVGVPGSALELALALHYWPQFVQEQEGVHLFVTQLAGGEGAVDCESATLFLGMGND